MNTRVTIWNLILIFVSYAVYPSFSATIPHENKVSGYLNFRTKKVTVPLFISILIDSFSYVGTE